MIYILSSFVGVCVCYCKEGEYTIKGEVISNSPKRESEPEHRPRKRDGRGEGKHSVCPPLTEFFDKLYKGSFTKKCL